MINAVIINKWKQIGIMEGIVSPERESYLANAYEYLLQYLLNRDVNKCGAIETLTFPIVARIMREGIDLTHKQIETIVEEIDNQCVNINYDNYILDEEAEFCAQYALNKINELQHQPHISIIEQEDIMEEDNIIAFHYIDLKTLIDICDESDFDIFRSIPDEHVNLNKDDKDVKEFLFCFKLSNELFQFILQNCPILIKFAETESDSSLSFSVNDLKKDLMQIYNFLEDVSN